MSDQPFVHLHCHSHYSLLDGASTIPALVKEAKKHGMNALALTDHGNLYGAVEFHTECKKAGIKPVVGYEAYVAPADRRDRSARSEIGDEHSFHLTLLAQNHQGFSNLLKLASKASLEGFYHKPRIDKELLEAHGEGLIVLSGCAAGELSNYILNDRLDLAEELAAWFAKRFDGRFFMEIQDNGLEIQQKCAAGTIEVAKRLGLPLVATCDSHYLCSDDFEAHEALLCINTGKTMSDPKRLKYGSDQFYLKPPAEMYAAFPKHAEAVKQSQAIADMVDLELDFKKRYFPVFQPPAGKSDQDYLHELCDAALERKFPLDERPTAEAERQAARQRLDWELGVICRQGYASYFLIVWDFVQWSLSQGIACGARGSACGALVSYLLEFSYVDPIKYDLLFERFLDPNRAKAPDIDIDFDQKRREEVIEYVRRKYGADRVSQIITFNTLAARAVLKDVGRAYEMPLADIDRLTKLVPARPGITLEKALAEVPELKSAVEKNPDNQRLLRIAKRLEGLARNPGVHAAGVVLGDRPLDEYIPLQKAGEQIVTQWEMGILEKIGALKFDFLGLRNLTLLTDAVRVIEQSRGAKLDLLALPLDDAKVYGLLQRGETKGVFQLESEGMRNLLAKMRPDAFHDIIAVLALYRPGPLGGGMVDTYINVKHGRQKAEYLHPVMKDVLEETYGVMVYQEQVMRILNRLGDIELAAAYQCIKAIGNKRLDEIAPYKQKFIDGSVAKGVAKADAERVFELIEFFAGYGFNKSHTTAYALIAYQTAYLKVHYPAEFMAALMSSETDKTDLLVEHIDDSRRMGLEVKPPDLNEGERDFAVHGNVLRFGLLAIKGVGEKAVDAIVAERRAKGRYKDLFDFCERIDQKLVPKATIEALVKAGAADSLGGKRRQLCEGLEAAYSAGVKARADRESGQGSLFGGDDDEAGGKSAALAALPNVPEWPDQEKLGYEKALLGVYLSSHPLQEHERKLRIFRSHAIAELADLPPKTHVLIGGMISDFRKLTTKKGKNINQSYARFALSDLTGSAPCVMFADTFALYGDRLAADSVVFLRAEIDTPFGGAPAPTPGEEGAPRPPVSLLAGEVIHLNQAAELLSGNFVVRIDASRAGEASLPGLRRVLAARPGSSPVYLEALTAPGLRVRMKAGPQLQVQCDEELVRQVEDLLGAGSARIAPNQAPRRDRR